MTELGDYLKGQRLRLNLSLREAAQSAGISNPYLSQIERGDRGAPHPNILKKLATAYKIDFNMLMKISGFLDVAEPEREAIQIEKEFYEAVADPQFDFGHRLREELDLETKRFIVEMYRKLKSQAGQQNE